jgi:hypothetical protein
MLIDAISRKGAKMAKAFLNFFAIFAPLREKLQEE